MVSNAGGIQSGTLQSKNRKQSGINSPLHNNSNA